MTKNQKEKIIRDTARKILKLYGGQRIRWTQYALARYPKMPNQPAWSGQVAQSFGVCKPNDRRAACWCLAGAVEKFIPPENVQSELKIDIVLNAMCDAVGEPDRIDYWNDDHNRKFSEVIDLLKKLAK